ncbi:MAG: hypothetical protein JWM74_5353, partial [Myxococcaceae bacterium]|nr:hypothetical protein [Myxococcaceae bacterium]
ALDGARRPTWLLRAGAIPLAFPRVPPSSATGRSLAAFGATDGDAQWTSLLARTGGDLSHAFDAASETGPAIRSFFVERPEAFAPLVRSMASRLAPLRVSRSASRSGNTDFFSHAAARFAGDSTVRAVRIPSFDVAYFEAMKVVQLVTTLHRGGAERVVLDLAHELDGLGVDVIVAVLDRASRTTFDAPPRTVFLDELGRDRRERLEALGALAIANGADLVHAHLVNGDDLRIIARSGIPLVTTIHNSKPGWPIRLDALEAGDVATAIACSRDVERQLLAARLPAPVRTIWNGIQRGQASPRRRSEHTDADKQVVTMLVVANHRPQKRLERLPTIVAELRSRGWDVRLRIVGEPVKNDPEMVAIDGLVRAEATRLGVADAIELVGPRSDVASLYDACDVVVSTSAFEGLSLVHLEALAAGLPLVTTAVAGTEELARKHPHAHVVALEASPAAFADAVVAAVSAPATTLAPTLAPDFTASKMAERHADLFARVLASRPRGAALAQGGAGPAARPRGGLVLVANNFSTGGAQSSARRLLLALAASGVPVRAIVIQEQAAFPTPGRAALVAAGIDVFVAPRAGDVDPIVTARAIVASIDDVAPDAVLFWNVISQHKVLVADLLVDIPIWDVSPGEMYFSSFEKYLAKPRVGSPYLTMRDYGRRLAGVIVKYEAERTRAEEALGAVVHVVPNGVVVPGAAPARPGGERIVIGTLARLSADKKLEQLVDAVADAHGRGLLASCELRIAGAVELGDEAYVDALRERANGLPITWVGEQDSAAFLAELDLFAMVSEPSGCPNASIEAMAAGLAVVATDVGGVRDQVVHGETGLLVPRGDAIALGEAIAELAADPARRAAMGRAGHARALETYDVSRMASDYARICLGITHLAAPSPSSEHREPSPPRHADASPDASASP